MSLADKLQKLKTTKEAIRTSINNKGGTLTESDTFSSYSTAIDNIQTGSGENPLQLYLDTRKSASYLFVSSYWFSGITSYFGFDTMSDETLEAIIANISFSNVIEMRSMFDGCKALTSIPQLDTSKVTNMSYMFRDCTNLITIPQLDTSSVNRMTRMFYGCSNLTSIPQLDTSSVTNMDEIFYNCSSLTTIPQLDTSNVINMTSMFQHCSNLTTIPQLDTSSVTDMGYMFYGCSSLTSIPALDASKVTGMGYMFYQCYKLEKIDITKLSNTGGFANGCYSLKTLIIRTMDTIPSLNSEAFTDCYHFYGRTNATYNPEGLKDGAIYVPDNKVEELKVATNWSVFADIIKPLSTLVEE